VWERQLNNCDFIIYFNLIKISNILPGCYICY